MSKIDPNEIEYLSHVKESLDNFLDYYFEFRNANNLPTELSSPFEAISSMADKLGRIARHVKHLERKDPKPNWNKELPQEMFGLLAYMVMLLDHYELALDFPEQAEQEMIKAIKQHAKKK